MTVPSREMPTDPDDLDRYPIRGRTRDNDLRDEAPQQGLALVVADLVAGPPRRETVTQVHQLRAQLRAQRGLCGCLGKAGGGLFGLAEGAQLIVPVAFEFSGGESVLRVDLLIASAGQVRAEAGLRDLLVMVSSRDADGRADAARAPRLRSRAGRAQ